MVKLFIILLLLSSNLYAKDKVFSPEFVATTAASMLNKSGSLDVFLKETEPLQSVGNQSYTKRLISSLNVKMSTPLPRFRAVKNKLYWGSYFIEIQKDETLLFEGNVLRPREVDLEKFFKRFEKEAKVARPFCLFPCALAGPIEDLNVWKNTILYFIREDGLKAALPMIGLVTGVLALKYAIIGAAAGAVVYLGKEMYETIRDGEITCSGKNFAVRKKRRGTAYIATPIDYTIDPYEVSQILQKEIPECTETEVKNLKIFFSEHPMGNIKTISGSR